MGKTKDTTEAWQDQPPMKQRDILHPEKTYEGCQYLSPASYTLTKADKEIIF
jgi:hypothetical protein